MSEENVAKQFGPLWSELMEVGRKAEDEKDSMANTMTEEQYYRIKSSIDYIIPYGIPDPRVFNAQLDFDLMGPPRYRLFDALGMGMGGRYGDDSDTKRWITKLAKAYIGCAKISRTRSALYDCVGEDVLKK